MIDIVACFQISTGHFGIIVNLIAYCDIFLYSCISSVTVIFGTKYIIFVISSCCTRSYGTANTF